MHSKFEDQHVVYDGDNALQSIKSFITEKVFGLVGHRTAGNTGEFSKKPLVSVYYDVDYVKNPKGTNYWRNRFEPLLIYQQMSLHTSKLSLCILSVF